MNIWRKSTNVAQKIETDKKKDLLEDKKLPGNIFYEKLFLPRDSVIKDACNNEHRDSTCPGKWQDMEDPDNEEEIGHEDRSENTTEGISFIA